MPTSKINHPGAWKASQFAGKSDLCVALSAKSLAALDEIMGRLRGVPMVEITRTDFHHPDLDEILASVKETLLRGRGALILTGLSRNHYNGEDLERICWGFGTHWGVAAIQNARGDRIGHVRTDPLNPRDRGYQSSRELTFHSDAHEILGLMCIERAPAGGTTRLVSALAIYNEILETRPDLLPSLCEGFRYAVAEGGGLAEGLTESAVPVFSRVKGLVSCMFLPRYMRDAARQLGTTLPAQLEEGIAYFNEVANRPGMAMEFMLEPGEMLVCHNFTNLHARTEFADGETRRHMLRLWLRLPDGRPVLPALLERGGVYERLHHRETASVATVN